jgi:hypothetical protein
MDFFDIFEGSFSLTEEKKIALDLWREWNEG